MLGQRLHVTQHQHPPGPGGAHFSLEKVAEKVKQGGVHPKVRAWALEQLERGRQELGLGMNNESERARALLRAVQKKLWVPDPVGAEFIAGAHLMACDRSTKDELCFLSGDCDDLVVLLGSCFLSANLQTAVVGHAYDGGKNISHVLCMVRVDGKWKYADPSTNLALGSAVQFTRERVLSVPHVDVICDEDVCFKDGTEFNPGEVGFVREGTYVGVDGPPKPKFTWLYDKSALGQTVRQRFEQTADACLDVTINADISTAAKREQAFGNGARCAADAYCATYGVPPGICSSIVGPVADAVADLWSSIFGGDPSVDCSRVSTFDPCHECKLQAECIRESPSLPQNPIDWPRHAAGISRCMAAKRKSCKQAEEQRILAETAAAAERAAAQAEQKQKTRPIRVAASVAAAGAAGYAAWRFWPEIRRLLP